MKKSLLAIYRISHSDYEETIIGYIIHYSDEHKALLKKILWMCPLAYDADDVDVLCIAELSRSDIADDGTLEYIDEYPFFDRLLRQSANILRSKIKRLQNNLDKSGESSIDFDKFTKAMNRGSFAEKLSKQIIEMLDFLVKPYWKMLFDDVELILEK